MPRFLQLLGPRMAVRVGSVAVLVAACLPPMAEALQDPASPAIVKPADQVLENASAGPALSVADSLRRDRFFPKEPNTLSRGDQIRMLQDAERAIGGSIKARSIPEGIIEGARGAMQEGEPSDRITVHAIDWDYRNGEWNVVSLEANRDSSVVFQRNAVEGGERVELSWFAFSKMYNGIYRAMEDDPSRLTGEFKSLGFEDGDVIVGARQRAPIWLAFTVLLLALAIPVGSGAYVAHRRSHRKAEEEAALQVSLFDALERDRMRTSRELHDGPLQTLYLVRSQLKDVGCDDESVQTVESLRDLLLAISFEVRGVVEDLHPPLLGTLGLEEGFRSHVDNLTEVYPTVCISYESHFQRGVRLGDRTDLQVFRILQEALQNALKHADASRIIVMLDVSDQGVRAFVDDNGRGLGERSEAKARGESGGIGLTSAKARAASIGGEIRLGPSPLGRGTRFELVTKSKGMSGMLSRLATRGRRFVSGLDRPSSFGRRRSVVRGEAAFGQQEHV